MPNNIEEPAEVDGEPAGYPETHAPHLPFLVKVAARELAEAGMSLDEVAQVLSSKGYGVSEYTIIKWSNKEGWATPRRVKKILDGTGIPAFRLQELLKPVGVNGIREIIARISEGNSQKEEAIAIIEEVATRTPKATKPTEIAKQVEGQGATPSLSTGKSVPNCPTLSPDSAKCVPKGREISEKCDKMAQSAMDLIEECLTPKKPVAIAGDALATVGEGCRPATAYELLPKDFEVSTQMIRAAEQMGKVESIRGMAYRENISRTLLKLSQYAANLADHDPRLALGIMKDIDKIDRIASKRFRLDDGEKENKASESLERLAEAEETGGGDFDVV